MWDQHAERAPVPLTDESTARLVAALAGDQAVEVGGQVLMKLQIDEFFKTASNPVGEYVHAVFDGGQVVAAAESREPGALLAAIEWAALVANDRQVC